MATKYPDKKFQAIYEGILNSMGSDDDLKANIEAALKPMYDQSVEQLRQQRIARNADIDVDAASRGMGNSTWVTDAKLRQLKDESANLAVLNANYNNQLYGALADAIAGRDDDAYNRALYWWQQQKPKGGGNKTPTVTPYGVPEGQLTFEQWLAMQRKDGQEYQLRPVGGKDEQEYQPRPVGGKVGGQFGGSNVHMVRE